VLRIGLLGASRIAPLAVVGPARRYPAAVVHAVAARDPERARAFARRHGIDRSFGSYAQLLEQPDIDAVYVALPPALAGPWVVAALEAGKHVLCEKPLGADCAAVQRMVAASVRTRRALVEAFHYRFHPLMVELLARLADDEIGAVRGIDVAFRGRQPLHDGEYRWSAGLGGGALLDLGCYALHAIRQVGGEPRAVTFGRAEWRAGVDARVRSRLELAGGIEARFDVSMVAATYRESLRVDGTAGAIEYRRFALPHEGGALRIRGRSTLERAAAAAPTTYDAQLAHFVAVIDGRERPLTGGEDAIANARALEAVRAAISAGRTGPTTPGGSP
jgi:predicted dehydrogenase